MPTHSLKDVTGQRFGRLRVLERSGSKLQNNGSRKASRAAWKCQCDCGNICFAQGTNLLRGSTRSCGCLAKESARATRITHGEAGHRQRGTPRYEMWRSAKSRARKYGIPFDISLDDIAIPERCPIFGTALAYSGPRATNHSPSLDRVIPALGYIKGNIQVISYRANLLKKDGTLKEFQALVDYLKINGGVSC